MENAKGRKKGGGNRLLERREIFLANGGGTRQGDQQRRDANLRRASVRKTSSGAFSSYRYGMKNLFPFSFCSVSDDVVILRLLDPRRGRSRNVEWLGELSPAFICIVDGKGGTERRKKNLKNGKKEREKDVS